MKKNIVKAGNDFKAVYNQLVELAQKGNTNEAEKIMNSYNITDFYQTTFWK